jgi:hypothetical protein
MRVAALRTLSACALLASASLFACDGDPAAATPQPTTDTGAATDTAAADPGAAQADPGSATDPGTASPDAGAGPDVAADVATDVSTKPPYPAGPYGTFVGDTIAPDVGFYDPWTKQWIYVSDYWNHHYMKAVIVSSAAGWCGPCQLEAVEFLDLYDDHAPWGLEILYALFEDTKFNALCTAETNADCAYEAKSMQFMNDWKNYVDVDGGRVIDYPLLMDPKGANGYTAMDPFYEENSVPMAILVSTKDMTIIEKWHGYSAAYVGYEVLKILYND